MVDILMFLIEVMSSKESRLVSTNGELDKIPKMRDPKT
jgi:hypothetical protein